LYSGGLLSAAKEKESSSSDSGEDDSLELHSKGGSLLLCTQHAYYSNFVVMSLTDEPKSP